MNFFDDIWSGLSGNGEERVNAEAVCVSLTRATDAASKELNTFFDELAEVVIAFNQKHILFGDRYFRLKFKLQPVRLPWNYAVQCAQLRLYANLFTSPSTVEKVSREAEAFYKYVMDHNHETVIRFLGYDNSVRKLLHTIDEVHLRQLVTLVSGGEAGGSPLGVNMLIHDFDNVGTAYATKRQEFSDLKTRIGNLKLKNPVKK